MIFLNIFVGWIAIESVVKYPPTWFSRFFLVGLLEIKFSKPTFMFRTFLSVHRHKTVYIKF